MSVLSPGFIDIVVIFGLVLGPILVAMLYKKQVQETPQITLEQVDAAYTRSMLLVFALLFCGSPFLLATGLPFAGLTHPLTQLTSFILAATWMGMTRQRYKVAHSVSLQAEPPITHAEHLQGTARMVAFILIQVLILKFLGIPGLLVIVFATPVTIRILFSSRPMAPSPFRDQIEKIFQDAGQPIQSIRLITTRRKSRSNALVCGSRFGFGPFRRTLLITQSLFELLEPDEILAVVRHEAAHFKLHHIAKRMGAVLLTLPLMALCCAVLLVALTKIYTWIAAFSGLSHPSIPTALQALTLLPALLIQNHLMYMIIHRQEHEADLEAVKLGSTPQAMVSALQKLTQVSGGENTKPKPTLQRLLLTAGHPSLEERESAILSGALPSLHHYTAGWRPLAFSFAALLALVFVPAPKIHRLERGPASMEPAKVTYPKPAGSYRSDQ